MMIETRITDFTRTPPRRSRRVPAAKKELEQKKIVYHMIQNPLKFELSLEVREVPGKGRGVFATRSYKRREFVCEYKGDLISATEGRRREDTYSLDPSIGSYIYFFIRRGERYCVDATAESPYKGRLLNHSLLNPNCYTQVFEAPDNTFYLCLFALRAIEPGEELVYDYGDHSAESVAACPWLIET